MISADTLCPLVWGKINSWIYLHLEFSKQLLSILNYVHMNIGTRSKCKIFCLRNKIFLSEKLSKRYFCAKISVQYISYNDCETMHICHIFIQSLGWYFSLFWCLFRNTAFYRKQQKVHLLFCVTLGGKYWKLQSKYRPKVRVWFYSKG